MTDPTPVPNADLLETLGTVLSSVTNNKRQVVARHEELTLELANNEGVQKQFDAMIHSLKLLVADPFALQQVADRLAADEAAKSAPPPSDPSLPAGASDPEGCAAPATEVAAVTDSVGTDADGSPVAIDASVAS